MPRVKGKQYPENWLHLPRVCPTCGKTFRRPRDQIHCSQGCRRFGKAECEGCGTVFLRKSSRSKYCLPSCRIQTKADRAALLWRRVRHPEALAERAARLVPCELPICGGRIDNPYNGQKYHEACYRVIHNMNVRNRRRLKKAMKTLTDEEYEDLSMQAILGGAISDEDWLACHEKAKADPARAPMGELLDKIAQDVVQTLYGVQWSEADQRQKVMALKRAQVLFGEGIEKIGKDKGFTL